MKQLESRNNQADFSPIFETLVDNASSELLGYVAYGLYKTAKREWVIDFRTRNGRTPQSNELADYTRTWTPAKLRSYSENAEQIVARFAHTIIEEARPQIVAEALQGTAWKSIGLSIAAGFIYTLILISLVIVLGMAGVDLLGILQDAAKR